MPLCAAPGVPASRAASRMLGKIGFWIARLILDAACQQHVVEPLRTRKAVTDVATPGKRLKLQIDELEWLADTGQDARMPPWPTATTPPWEAADASDRDRHLRGSPANQHRADTGSRRWRCGHDQELRHRDR